MRPESPGFPCLWPLAALVHQPRVPLRRHHLADASSQRETTVMRAFVRAYATPHLEMPSIINVLACFDGGGRVRLIRYHGETSRTPTSSEFRGVQKKIWMLGTAAMIARRILATSKCNDDSQTLKWC